LAVSFIAEKFNLFVNYSSYELIKQLGIYLFIGEKKFDNTIQLNDENFFDIYNNSNLNSNLNPNNNYFQTKEITNFLYSYLNDDKIKKNIIESNQFNERYNNNNDLCIHIRLTDAITFNPGIHYYFKAISQCQFENLFSH
jgi:hypothetical protein